MRLSSSSPSHQTQEGEQKPLNSELWHACAGPLVSLPAVGSRVVYFPQGHSEQVAASTNREIDSHIPNYPSLPPQLICQLHNVTMNADVETDEVYAQMTLQPLSPQEQKDPFLPVELGTPSKQPTNYFCKTLTASDTSTHGGFSVPRRAAEKVFPPLDFSLQPPAQELIAWDLHGNEWKFRHIFRGQPKRHLLTTGWSVFVSAKRLVAGDSVLFIWNENNQLLLGIRRANRPQTVMPSSVLSSDSMHIGLLAAAAHAAATNSRFTIFYNPRASPSEFVIPLAKYAKAVYHTRVSVGMRFRMLFETEESSVRRYMGTITGISDLDPVRWPNSHWRSVKVGWDESTAGERQPRVSLWEIEPLTTFPMYPSPFPLRLKRPWPSGLPSLHGIKDEDISLNPSLMWFRDGRDQGFQSLNFQGLGVSPWMQPRIDTSFLGMQPDIYQAMAANALQEMRALDPTKQANPAMLQFQQPQNIISSSHLLPGQVLQQVQPQSQQTLLQIIQGNQVQNQAPSQFLQHQLQRCNSLSDQQQHQTPSLPQKQVQQIQHQHQQVQQQQQQHTQQQKHLSDQQQNANIMSGMPQLIAPSQPLPPTLQAISSFTQNQNFVESNGNPVSASVVSPLHNLLQSLASEESSGLLSLPRSNPLITSATWPSKRVAVESVTSGAQLEQLGTLQSNIPQNSVSLPSFPGRECSVEQDGNIDPQSHLLFGVNIDSPLLNGFRNVGNEGDSAVMPYAAANFMSSADNEFPLNQTMTGSNCFDESALIQASEDNVSQINPQSGTFVKVYKSGSFGRSLDITRFSSYDELRSELARLFGLEGQLEDPLRSGWQLVFVDRESDVLLLGDDPWQELIISPHISSQSCLLQGVREQCIVHKDTLAPRVQQMGKQGVNLLNSVPLKRLSSSSCDDYGQDSRNLIGGIPSVGTLDYLKGLEPSGMQFVGFPSITTLRSPAQQPLCEQEGP